MAAIPWIPVICGGTVRRTLLITSILTLVWPIIANASTPYAIQGGYEELDNTGERVRALRIPLYFTLRHWDDRPFGLRLRVAGTLAINDLEDVLDGDIEQVRMISFMPGLEFIIPFGRNHMLRPFLDMGVGTENQTGKEALLVDAGLRTEFIFAGRHFFYGLEPGFQVSSHTGTELLDESVFNPFITLTARRVLGFTIDKHQPDGEIYFEAGYDFNTFELSSVRSTNDAINTNLEVGLGFGFSQTRPKIWIFTLPRLRVGYRFGDLEGWRIRFGGDWLTRVVGLNTPQ